MSRKRLTTDTPQNNTETMLNYAYAKNRQVILRYGNGKEDIDICEYISEMAKDKPCHPSPDDVMDGACLDCDCEFAMLCYIATQAAELRERLKEYEDTGLSPQEIIDLKFRMEELEK